MYIAIAAGVWGVGLEGEVLVGTTVVLGLGIGLTLLIAYLASRGREHPFKRARYECANPPKGRARVPMLPQYHGYILLFIVLDPLFMLIFLGPLAVSVSPLAVALWLSVVTVITLPPLLYGLRYASRFEYWAPMYWSPEEAEE